MVDLTNTGQTSLALGASKDLPGLASTKILLAYASAGKGHETACRAIAEAIKERGFDGEIVIIDSLKYMPTFMARIFSKGYLHVASKMPWLWYAFYESKSSLSEFEPPPPYQNAFWKIIMRRFGRYLKEQKPDYIISAYFTSSWVSGRYKQIHNPRCRVATVVTDYGIHPVWLAPGQDRYFVATEDIKYELANLEWYTSTGQDKIEVVGIPVERNFGQYLEKAVLLEKYQFEKGRFTVLLLTAVYGRRHVEAVIDKLLKCNSRLQILIVAYDGFQVGNEYVEALKAKNIPYRIYGKISFMADLMTMADVAITKSGGLASTECLICGCPLLIYKPYPGQEERNSALFLESGAAWRIFQLESLPFKIDTLAGDPEIHQ